MKKRIILITLITLIILGIGLYLVYRRQQSDEHSYDSYINPIENEDVLPTVPEYDDILGLTPYEFTETSMGISELTKYIADTYDISYEMSSDLMTNGTNPGMILYYSDGYEFYVSINEDDTCSYQWYNPEEFGY